LIRIDDLTPVLSIRREYAEQVVTTVPGFPAIPQKWIENRTWKPVWSSVPTLLIHASGPGGAIIGAVTVRNIIDTYGRDDEDCNQLMGRLKKQVRKVYRDYRRPKRMDWSCADDPCMADSHLFWWLLSHPVRFAQEVPCKGKLNLWYPDSQTLTAIVNQSINFR
jgi:predicted transcriptional regulator